MTNDEVKVLSNMAMISKKIEIKNFYTEEDYSNIFKLIDGFKDKDKKKIKIEKYFRNKDIINILLDKEINGYKIYDLIRISRNRDSHIDKINGLEALVLLQTKVDIKDIHTIINEIKSEIENIFKDDLNSDAYRLIMNSKPIINLFEIMKTSIYNAEPKSEFDKKSKNMLSNLLTNFKYDDSTLTDFEKFDNDFLDIAKSDDFKNEMIKQFGEGL